MKEERSLWLLKRAAVVLYVLAAVLCAAVVIKAVHSLEERQRRCAERQR